MQKRLKIPAEILPFTQTRPRLGLKDFSLTLTINRPTCTTLLHIAFGPSDILMPGVANNAAPPRMIYSTT